MAALCGQKLSLNRTGFFGTTLPVHIKPQRVRSATSAPLQVAMTAMHCPWPVAHTVVSVLCRSLPPARCKYSLAAL